MELYYIITVTDRSKADKLLSLHEEIGLPLILTNLGSGTATSDHLLLYDLENTEKSVIAAVADRENMNRLMKFAKQKMFIDIPGNGIMTAIPIKSVGGRKTLDYLTNEKESSQTKGAAPDMNFENELIIVILNEGFSDAVMDSARSAGASGGTVIHAKGTGKSKAERFFGVTLAEEKDIIYIVAPSSKKSAIMKEICKTNGIGSDAGAICFSLPVSETVGLRRLDNENE